MGDSRVVVTELVFVFDVMEKQGWLSTEQYCETEWVFEMK